MALDIANREETYEWYSKAKDRGTWDPVEIDIQQDIKSWNEGFTEEEQFQFMTICAMFYEGEESVARTLTPYPLAVGALEDPGFDTLQEEMYLSTQIFEEAKHTEFFSRYFEEVFGTQNTDHWVDDPEKSFWVEEWKHFLIDELDEVSSELRQAIDEDQRTLRYKLAEALMHYMGCVEAESARVGYEALLQVLEEKEELKGFQRGLELTIEDEGRHIANGRWLMGQLAEDDPEIVTEVYEPLLNRCVNDLLPPLIQHAMDPNPLEIDASVLFDKAKGNYQSTIDAIGREHFEAV